ncbi:Pentatricopeptide repeat-containing protein [Actinidia chinensis var. chinensis]|uniref:Pentatricopeptide repeat-containing protein n=1 Tax=Actinidia chinensis var. chinensis TaxID=1590841 RepID=A0A2R6Q9T7_ACTCC|nr:Pentatricopeptide repeat-containing protein [Actinidia chinensis var. chinensis]
MRFCSLLANPHTKTIEHKVMSLLQDSTKLDHLLQIHSFIIKTSLHHNKFVLAKFLGRFSSCSSSNDLSYARSIFDSIQSPDTFIWNTMIRACLNSKNTREAFLLFAQMPRQRDVFVDSFSLSLVFQACGRSMDCLSGETIHTQVLKLGFGSDLFVQTALIEMYANFGWIGVARKMFDEMSHPDVVSYNVLLAEYVRVGEMSLAQELFDKMPERDLVSWNTMIHGYASVGDFGALRLFHEMQLANVVPDKVTMLGVLLACGEVGALHMGTMVHEYIERSKTEIDIKLGTALVDMYAKCGDIYSSLRVFNLMNEKDVFAWSAVIVGLANHGLGDLALEHFSKMISEQIKPNDITLIGVLSACGHIGLVDEGMIYFKSMIDVYGISPKIEHFGCMVDMLGRAGRLQEARELIRSMPFAPDAIVWRTLLGACRIYKNVELEEEAIVNLLELEPNVDGNYVLLSNIYSQAKKWDKVVNVRRTMKNIDIQKDPGSSSIEVDNAVHEFVVSDTSHQQSEEIYQVLAEMTDRLKHVGYQELTPSLLDN